MYMYTPCMSIRVHVQYTKNIYTIYSIYMYMHGSHSAQHDQCVKQQVQKEGINEA